VKVDLRMADGTHDFTGICPPPACEQTIPVFGLDEGRLLDDAPRKLREGVAEGCDSLHLHPEAALLGHGCIETDRA
jgi:hypothetical protein